MLTPEMTETFDKLMMELRGYEVARLLDNGRWERVIAYQPNDVALRQAKRDANWFQWRASQRQVKETYRVRPIISLDIDFVGEARRAKEETLTLAADPALVSPEALSLAPEPLPEESLVQPDSVEIAYKVPSKADPMVQVELPLNYDQLADSIDIPSPWGNE